MRVVGGFTEHQFAEKRLPTLDEINAIAPDTPVFILHLYDRALLNGAALRAVGYTKDTPNPPGGEIERDAAGNPTGLLLAKPNATILYATLAKGPKLPPEYQLNSTRHFMREMNRLGVTSVIDAGGGFQNYPDDYAIIEKLHADGELTLRIAYNLFTQKPKEELADFASWAKQVKPGQGDDLYRHNGAGEMLVYSAADFEDFRVERPEMPPSMEGDLEPVVRLLAENRWPWRLHATYNETITRALDVFEKVNRDMPLAGPALVLRPLRDDRRPQHRPHRGARRRHRRAAPHDVPGRGFRRALRRQGRRAHAADRAHAGGRRAGRRRHRRDPRRQLQPLGLAGLAGHRQDAGRPDALSAAQPARPRDARCGSGPRPTPGSRPRKARRARSRPASSPISSCSTATTCRVPEDEIQDIESVLTLLGGKSVHRRRRLCRPRARRCRRRCRTGRRCGPSAATRSAPALDDRKYAFAAACGCASACGVHGHAHAERARGARAPARDEGAFWGALGCSCWAF